MSQFHTFVERKSPRKLCRDPTLIQEYLMDFLSRFALRGSGLQDPSAITLVIPILATGFYPYILGTLNDFCQAQAL